MRFFHRQPPVDGHHDCAERRRGRRVLGIGALAADRSDLDVAALLRALREHLARNRIDLEREPLAAGEPDDLHPSLAAAARLGDQRRALRDDARLSHHENPLLSLGVRRDRGTDTDRHVNSVGAEIKIPFGGGSFAAPAVAEAEAALTEAEAAARQIPIDEEVLAKAEERRFRRALVRQHLLTFFNLDMIGAAIAMYLLARAVPYVDLIYTQSTEYYQDVTGFQFTESLFIWLQYLFPGINAFAQNNALFERHELVGLLGKQLVTVVIYGLFIQFIILIDFYRKEYNRS